MQSALYVGVVRHRRHGTPAHRFAYPIFQLYADLGELDAIFAGSWLASTRRPAWAWLRRRDHFGDPSRPWAEGVRDEVEQRLGRRPEGAVRLLTHPRTLGFRMNPVSFFYCFDGSGALDAVVGEVTNTPWDERHLYVVDARAGRRGASFEARFPKALHVSPFLPMDLEYRWRFTPPGERLAVHMEDWRAGRKLFDATLRLERRALSPSTLRRTLLAYPALTLKVFSWIYLNAAWLTLKGATFHAHPAPRTSAPPPQQPEAAAASSSGSRAGSSRAA